MTEKESECIIESKKERESCRVVERAPFSESISQ